MTFIQVIHVLHLHFNHASAQNNDSNLFPEGESLTSYTEKHVSSGGEVIKGREENQVCKPGDTKVGRKNGHRNFLERGCLWAAWQSPDTPARCSLLSLSMPPTLDTYCYCCHLESLSYFPYIFASFFPLRVKVWLAESKAFLLVFSMLVGREKECLVGTYTLPRFIQCLFYEARREIACWGWRETNRSLHA